MAKKILWSLLLCGVLLSGCPATMKHYAPLDKKSRKSQQLDFSIGRFFAYQGTACLAVRIVNWSKESARIERHHLVLKSQNIPLKQLGIVEAGQTAAIRQSLRQYHGKVGNKPSPQLIQSIYFPSPAVIAPGKAKTGLVCYRLPQEPKEPYSLHIQKLSFQKKPIKVKPFTFRQMQRPKKQKSSARQQ